MDSESETMRDKSHKAALVIEKDIKPLEKLFIKCKEDWIHHLAQALSFSLLTTLIPIAIVLLSIFSRILGLFDTQTQKIFSRSLDTIIPQPLALQTTLVFSKAYDALSHDPPVVIVFLFLFYVVFGSFLFSLMEACFD